MDDVTNLVELLKTHISSDDEESLYGTLRSDAAKSGFTKLYSILKQGFGNLELEQIRAIISVLKLVVFCTRSLSVDKVEPIVIATVQQSIEFAITYLESSKLGDDDLHVQNDIILLLELSLLDGIKMEFDFPSSLNLVDLIPISVVQLDGSSLKTHTNCGIQGASFLREKKGKEQVLQTLSSGYVQPEDDAHKLSFLRSDNYPDRVGSLSQHWAVVHVGCFQHLLMICKESFGLPDVFDEKSDGVKKMYFSLRILKLLHGLAKAIPFVEHDKSLLEAVALLANSVPKLFRYEVDCVNSAALDSIFETVGLSVLEEFLLLIRIIFCNSSIFQNVQACIIASFLDIWDSDKLSYNKSASNTRTPLAYFPRVVIYVLELLEDVKRRKHHALAWKEHERICPDLDMDYLSCYFHSAKVLLMKQHTVEELVNLIFPMSRKFVDNLMHLLFFLHSEGEKLWLKLDKSCSNCMKPSIVSEPENTACHEDEALFGDLFSEGRSVGSTDGYDQPPVSGISASNCSNMPFSAALELLDHLKTSVFVPESYIYEEGCKQLKKDHIDYLLSIINCESCLFDKKTMDSGSSSQQQKKTIGKINEICFQLLQNLVTQHALSNSLEEYLVDRILGVDYGHFIYSDQALVLVAHTLICRMGPVAQLTTNIYRGYITFINEKVRAVLLSSISLRELLSVLPTVFHVEILLLGFHLSSTDEKGTLAKMLFSTLRDIDIPTDGSHCTQLSCWALLVSRLVLVLRHMMFHPTSCPPSLLLDLRSKLRNSQLSGLHNLDNITDHSSFWTSVVENVMDVSIREDPFLGSLLNQLIDFAAFSSLITRDDSSDQSLSLSWDDVYTCFARIVGCWKGKKAETVEDLILERYIFVLCWDIPVMNTTADHLLPCLSDSHIFNLSNLEHLFHFRHSLLRHCSNVGNVLKNPDIVLTLLQDLDSSHISADNEQLGWNFSRSAMWLSLLLSLLSAGIYGYAMKNNIRGVDHLSIGGASDVELLNFSEGLVLNITEADKVGVLLQILASLLEKCLKVYQKAFLSSFGDCQSSLDSVSPFLLLKSTVLDKSMQDELLNKCRWNSGHLESLYELLHKLDGAVAKRALVPVPTMFWESMLHGFPSLCHPSSGLLLSSVLITRSTVCLLECLLKVNHGGNTGFRTKTILQILKSIMIVKSDKIFAHLHSHCEPISAALTTNLENLNYSSIFFLKEMEMFLRHINAGETRNCSIHEWVVNKTIDAMDVLRRDPSDIGTLKFYLGAGDVSEQIKGHYGSQQADLMVLVDSLENCFSESVNTKVLNFFTDLISGDLSPDMKRRVQNKFLGMNLSFLSKWLEIRLLGCSDENLEGVASAKGSSVALRESVMRFLTCLVSPQSESHAKEVHGFVFEALLLSLNVAFETFDFHTAKSYYNFVVQLSRNETSLKRLMERTLTLMQKLAREERLLQGLKFLFGFLGNLFSECGSSSSIERSFGKSFSGTSLGVVGPPSSGKGSREHSESVVLTASQEEVSIPLDCDATSVDEDDDDGTSDGEVASSDKDEEDDAISDKALASKMCTYTSSGSNFMEQHWYFCYTCDLTVSKGCCSVCAKVCHRGHRVVYSRSSRFFCDCGAGGVRGSNCQCLKPRKFTGSNGAPARSGGSSSIPSFLPFNGDGDHLPDSDSELDEGAFADMDNSVTLSIPKELQERIPSLLEELDVEGRVLEICSSVLPYVVSRREANLCKGHTIILGEDKVLSFGVELLQLKKAYKSGSLDLKIKTDYTNAKEIKSLIASGSLVKSLLSLSVRGRLAVGEGDKVSIFDVGQLIGQATATPVTADKANVKPLSKNIVRFEILHLSFNPVVENYLAVAGYEDFQILTVSHRGEVTDRLAVELALQGAYIRRVDWVPGSQVQLMVVTNKFVKVYDLSKDNISPIHYFTLPDGVIVDASLFVGSQGRLFLVVLSENGSLFKLDMSMESDVGARKLTEKILVKERDIHAKGSSLYFSPTYKLLFISYQDGASLIGRLNPEVTSLTEVSSVNEDEQDGKLRPAGLHYWKELLVGSGLFVCISSAKSNSALAISMGAHELLAQDVRHAVGSSSPLVGITAYKPLSKDKIHCLVLHDDGSLQIYSHVSSGVDALSSMTSDKVKKLGPGILNNKNFSGSNPEFPLDFFEKTVCITADVKFGGDTVKNGDSEGAKQSLASEDGYLESPSPAGFKITVSNSNPDIVMVGFRVHVGNTSANHIPSSIYIFQRVINLDEGMRSWYDIPFTVAESLLADEEFTISVGTTLNGSFTPRIDSLEVYGRAKDEFGWREKMDAILDLEARALGCSSWSPGSGKKFRFGQSTPIQEQVVADGIRLLSKVYGLCRPLGCSRVEEVQQELGKMRCLQVLETIFESDREPLLRAAACCVLQIAFPKRKIYYQVKDTMRLSGVLKCTSTISSRLGVGGTTGEWIIEEFTAQMCAVSKIAVHRQSNLAMFLEINGPEVVDGLMKVLWGILDIEQPDTQIMNNIVISSVELIYCYAECLALHGKEGGECSVAPAVVLLRKLLLSSNEAVQTSSSLAIASRLLQVPFPKQTMIASDEAENVATAPVRNDTSGGNSQVMIEEDSITSSVQYCCDGCSTVPILRRRWHCTICPDFDLCEACYEVLDADRLPPPHSRDHPMTAMPIEVETIGGDGNEVHFTADEFNESTMLQMPEDSGFQNSSTPIHVLEHNESGQFSASVIDPGSISASKQAVNSLLLSELLVQLKGWMETTSGIRAIPVIQLFNRLSSAIGGPFIRSLKSDGLDLQELIKWFLEEINLNKPFVARNRSSFGEVSILVFMFFTLMLRNWHQPGSDGATSKSGGTSETHDRSSTPPSVSIPASSFLDEQGKNDFASQLIRACSTLRQQAFVNYLMDILQQLVSVFKSPAVNFDAIHGMKPGSGCGALLTVRRELPAGNFSPFFSDSYVKAHRSDMFIDYHRLLLENTFRLVYSLIRPEKQEKSGEKEKVHKVSYGKDLKLDGYQDVLCSYINNSHTTFVRRYARRLFLHLCGSKTQYYSVRDTWQFSSEVKQLYKHINKSGGFQNPASYERSVKIVKCLSIMAEVAAARPRNWQKYCLRHGDVLSFMVSGIFHFGEEFVIQTLKLLNLAFYSGKDMSLPSQKPEAGDAGTGSNKSTTPSADSKKKKKGEDGNESSSEKSYMDMESVVDIFSDKGGDVLRQFIDCFLLEWNSSSVRTEAKCVLHGAWHHGKLHFKEALLMNLLQKVKFLPIYGQNIIEYTELVTWLLGKTPDNSSKNQVTELVDRCLTADIIKCIFETLHSQNELLANHPNSRIYTTLSGLVEFDGYYLESEPCVACSSPEVPYSRMKLESLKSETKFTDNRIIVKCTGSYTIQTVTMNVHDARKSKSVKVLNLYYNNRPVADLSELKNNWSLWRRAKSCHLSFNQTELKVEFPIPITACNFMIELDSFYENLQALSLEPLQCPRCSRPVTDKHGICSNCHENAYQCRQCRNINYENLDSFLCNECGYSKYGRFEFNFTAKPSFSFDNIENEDDMKRGLTAIESESENAHRRYQQLLGFKKPLLKIVSSIGENEMDSQQKDSFQQMMVSLPGPSCKINRKIALLGVLYGEKCKAAFDSVSKSVQTLQGLRRVLMNYLHHKHSDDPVASRVVVPRTPYSCYGCAATFVTQCLEMLQVLSKHPSSRKQLVSAGILSELFENNIHQGPKAARVLARAALCAFSEGDVNAVTELNTLVQKKVMYCLEHHHSMDISQSTREEMLLLSEVCSLADEFWESRLRLVFQLLFASVKLGAKHPAVSEHVIFPCLRIVSQACTPPKPETVDKEQGLGKSTPVSHLRDEKSSKLSAPSSGFVSGSKAVPDTAERVWDSSQRTQDMQLLSYSEWEKGASYLDFVRRQYKVSQSVKGLGIKSRSQRSDFLALKYGLRWKRRACKTGKSDISTFELGSWVTELVLSPSSQAIRSEMCMLISLLCAQNSSRRYRMLNLLIALLPATLCAGESAAEYFDLLFKMIDTEEARLFLTAQGCLSTLCKLISQEVGNIESLERSLHIDISQGFILHKLIEILGKFLEVPNIRSRFMRDNFLSDVLEALIVIRGLIMQKTKLISDCNRLLKDLLDSLLVESSENKRQFIRACISGLQLHGEEKKGWTSLFIFEQLCNLICPSKPESVYLLILNKAHTQEEFIRGSMTKNPYSSSEIGPLMRDVKNKICHQLDLLGLLEDDYGMELLVAGNIISLDLSIAQVCEQVWRKSNSQSSISVESSTLLSSNSVTSSRESSPIIVTYRLQGLDGEATEPMIKELEENREETQDPEIEFAIAGTMREYGGLEIVMGMIQRLRDDLKSNQEQLVAVLNLLMLCCKIRENRRALLRLGALGLLLETARRAFSVDAMEPAEGILLIVESLTMEANESDNINITESGLTVSTEETGSGQQAKKIVLMFLERLSHPSGLKKSNKQQRNTEMVARILPYLTYGEPAAMEALIQHFEPYLLDWCEFDRVQEQSTENSRDEAIALQATKKRFAVENFVRVSESLKTSSCGERLKDIIIEKGITAISIQHLRNNFAVTGQVGFKSTAEWAAGLKLPSVPLILSMLKGLSMGHLLTQKCIEDGGILPLLHALEGVSGENEIGARAENLLDTLSDKEGKGDGFLGEKILSLRHATRDEMRRKALQKREELLQGLGMRRELSSDGGERIVVSRPFLEGLEDVAEEEDGLACMVCREGYSLRPSDLLGVYSYSKRVNLGVGNSGSARGECVYTTVSHFNIIHFQCHQEAKRADAALKNPKKEWEGATLRNNETLCNSLFPLRGPSVPMTQYTRYVDQYWDNLNALGRADGSRLRLLTYDVVLMLARFATGASFSADSKGGGRESNSRFLPFMIQMAHYLLDQGSPSQRRSMAKSVSAYISSSGSDSKPSTASSPGLQQSSISGTEETVQFMMVNSVLSESYESWLQHRRAFLQRGIYHAYMQHTHGRPTPRASASPIKSDHGISSSGTGESELLPIVQPMLVYTGLIEQLQKFFKVTASGKQGSMKSAGTSSTRAAEVEEESGCLEGWEVVMKEKLLDVKEMVGFSKELLSWLEEMTSATDLLEAFDIIGVLADVLSEGFSRCEDFVHAAIESGKS